MDKTRLYTIGAIGGGLLLLIGVLWVVFAGTGGSQTPGQGGFGGFFGGATTIPVVTEQAEGTNEPIVLPQSSVEQKIFKVADGPVAGLTVVQYGRPTTTVARFIMQTNGHVFDLALDSPGAVARPVSNTTIPGIARTLWTDDGSGAVVQYLDQGRVKTAYLAFPPLSTSTLRATRIQFLPEQLVDIALSPNGSVAYLLATANGTDGYIARLDTLESRKVFSLPLKDILLSWPSADTLLAQSKAGSDIAGIAFSITASSGTVTPILAAPGLTVIADRGFAYAAYVSDAYVRTAYVHTVSTGQRVALPLEVELVPEKCAPPTRTGVLYCAVPAAPPAGYADLWRMGAASVSDFIVRFNLQSASSVTLAIPGSRQGGEPADVAFMAVSPDERYAVYARRGDRSVWGVRLGSQ